MSFLDKVRLAKETEVQELGRRQAAQPFVRDPGDPVRRFGAALRGSGGIIAEVKRRSPSRPDFRLQAAPAQLAACYQRGGAVALSVVTDEANFGTCLADLAKMRRASRLPVISKDFVIDGLQVRQAWAAGADAVLLIARLVGKHRLRDLLGQVHSLGLEALVECHDEQDIDKSLAAGARIVGVNNRDLAALTTDLAHGQRLLPLVPERLVRVSESGLERRGDVERMAACGADAFLVGHALLLSGDPGRKLRELGGLSSEEGVRVKICGLTTVEDARLCQAAGADLLGLIFAESPRRVTAQQALSIREAVPAVRLCGVFADEDPLIVTDLARNCGLDLIQLHGRETPEQCRVIAASTGAPLIKALTPDQVGDGTVAAFSAVRYFLIDQAKQAGNGPAGAGDPQWRRAARSLAAQGAELILAGGFGLDGCAAGCAAAIAELQPFAVDVCRGVESSPGRKDPARIARFLQEVSR